MTPLIRLCYGLPICSVGGEGKGDPEGERGRGQNGIGCKGDAIPGKSAMRGAIQEDLLATGRLEYMQVRVDISVTPKRGTLTLAGLWDIGDEGPIRSRRHVASRSI